MESELVAGYFTEHSSHLFVYFFLAEYSSILLYSTVTVTLFFGGYNFTSFLVLHDFLHFLVTQLEYALVTYSQSSLLLWSNYFLGLFMQFLGLSFLTFFLQSLLQLGLGLFLALVGLGLKIMLILFPYSPFFVLGLKSGLIASLFVLVRATLPRLRYDQLISLCWNQLLPIAIAFIILIPSLIVIFDMAISTF